MQPALGQAAELRVDREAAEEVAADRDHDDARAGALGEPREEGARRAAEGEQFLELIDEHGRRGIDRRHGHRPGRLGIRAGREQGRRAGTALQHRQQPSAQQRRLPASGRAREHQQRARPQPLEADGDLGVAAEEALRVALAVGGEALVRARLADARRLRRPGELSVLAQDPQLERRELRAQVEPELLGQRAAGDANRRQRIGLAPGAVARERQDLPPALPPRLLGHQRLRVNRDLTMLARGQPRAEPVLLDRAAQLVQPGRLAAARRPAVELVERMPAPQAQRARVGRGARTGSTRAPRARPATPAARAGKVLDVEHEPVSAGSV